MRIDNYCILDGDAEVHHIEIVVSTKHFYTKVKVCEGDQQHIMDMLKAGPEYIRLVNNTLKIGTLGEDATFLVLASETEYYPQGSSHVKGTK